MSKMFSSSKTSVGGDVSVLSTCQMKEVTMGELLLMAVIFTTRGGVEVWGAWLQITMV